mmetsp:Transcript_23144/g.25365  ORF Transcript_23144/g.25365 Transcript_23144/m.25365 type:complete len:209 (+) Transcript_23144:31-657(+)
MDETPLYAPPETVSLGEALHLIFTHYCAPWKSTFAEQNFPEEVKSTQPFANSMDGVSFARMCREAPDLDQYIGRTEIDIIFSKAKPPGIRRLNYDHFLDALLALAVRIYPDENPTIALSNFLARFIFALFDQGPSPDGVLVIDRILTELSYEGGETMKGAGGRTGMTTGYPANTAVNSPGGFVSGISNSPETYYYQSPSDDNYYEYEQ